MTRQENILTLNEHLEHWKRLLSEKICDQDEGEKTIDALQNAIKALEQQDKISDAIKEIRDLLKQPAAYVPNYDAYGLCLSIICKHMEVEE